MSGEQSAYYVVWDGVGVRNEDGSPAFVIPRVASHADRREAILFADPEPRFSRNRLSRAKKPEERVRRCNSKDLRAFLESHDGWHTVGEVSKQSAYTYNQTRNALHVMAKQEQVLLSYRKVGCRTICLYAKLGTAPER